MRFFWPFTFNVINFAGFAFLVPFLVLFYQSVEFTGAQIGLLAGLPPLITLIAAPFWTSLADATHRHRLIMSVALLVAAGAASTFPILRTFTAILGMTFLFNAFIAPVPSFADSAAMHMLGEKRAQYGRIRMGGTIGFGLAGYAAGVLVQTYSLDLAFWGCAALFLVALLVSQKLVHSPVRASMSTRRGMGALLKNPRWLLFLTMAFAGGLAITTVNIYLYPYLADLGAAESMMGLALAIGALSEIPVLFFGHRLLRRFKPYGLLVVATAITSVRLLGLAFASSPAAVLVVQLLNGLTFPAMWIAGVAYADENAPAGLSATAQGLFGAMVFGFGAAVGGFAGGFLLESVGGRGLYLVFGIIVLVILLLVVLLQRSLPDTAETSPTAAMD